MRGEAVDLTSVLEKGHTRLLQKSLYSSFVGSDSMYPTSGIFASSFVALLEFACDDVDKGSGCILVLKLSSG